MNVTFVVELRHSSSRIIIYLMFFFKLTYFSTQFTLRRTFRSLRQVENQCHVLYLALEAKLLTTTLHVQVLRALNRKYHILSRFSWILFVAWPQLSLRLVLSLWKKEICKYWRVHKACEDYAETLLLSNLD